MSSEHMHLPQVYTCKLVPKWLGSFVINKVISPVAFCMDLALKYGWLHPVFHASWLKPHIFAVHDTEPPVILNDKDFECNYEVE